MAIQSQIKILIFVLIGSICGQVLRLTNFALYGDILVIIASIVFLWLLAKHLRKLEAKN